MKSYYTDATEERKLILANGGIPVEVKCDVCGETHYQGWGCYPLRKVRGYGFFCCKICYAGNWDGWNPDHEAKILAYLKEKGIEPPLRNAKGWLPQEF